MSSGIITLLSLLGFLSVFVWVYIIKSGADFEAQARQPLEDELDEQRVQTRRYTNQDQANGEGRS
ncbi:MAG: hypothetical protein AAGH65_00270 [Pseudomonadota bacterium]